MGKRTVRATTVAGLVIAVGLSGNAMAVKKPSKRAFTRTNIGAAIGPREEVEKVTDSLNGRGAAVVELKGTTMPLTMTATVTTYFANGVSIATDTATATPPNAAGIGTLSGRGRCVGGTGIHRKEKCQFTTSGIYNVKTGVDTVKYTGTVTR